MSAPVQEQCSDEELARDSVRKLARRPEADRERGVELLAARLDTPLAVLGIVFLLVVLGQTTATGPGLQRGLAGLGWALWAVFVAEFLLRLWLAPSRVRFLRRNWWQIVFLALPMLRVLRTVALLRAGRVLRAVRAGGVVGSAVRSSRSAGRILTNRIGWVAAFSAIVVLASSQLLFTLGYYDDYGDALHAAAMTTITGQQLELEDGLARLIEIILMIYSVGVFAALAGTLGAYFFDHQRTARDLAEAEAAALAGRPSP